MVKINNLPEDDPYVNKAYDTADQIQRFFVEICYLAQSLLQVIKHLSLTEGLVAADWKKLLLLSIFLKNPGNLIPMTKKLQS